MPLLSASARTASSLVAILLSSTVALSQQPMPATQPSGAQPLSSSASGSWEGILHTPHWPIFLTLTVRNNTSAPTATLEVQGQTLRSDEIRLTADSALMKFGQDKNALLVNAHFQEDSAVGRLVEGKDSFAISLRKIPIYPKPANRVEAWSQDIDALMTRFIELDKSFTADERSKFMDVLARTKRELPQLNDNQVIARMASAIALAHNAHTRLYLVRNSTELRRLPVRLWWFTDGLRVVRTTPDRRALLGCRVDKIAGLPVQKARDMVAPAYAGNEQWVDYISVYSLTTAELLNGFGVTPTADSVVYQVSDCRSSVTRIALKPLPLVKRSSAVEAWWDLSPRFPGADSGWVQVLASRADKLPLYLTNPKNYWFEYLPSSGVLYFQYNRSDNMPGETVAQFGERLLAALEQHQPHAFVLDLRFNTGGNSNLAEALMKRLMERTAGIARYLVTSRVTFSAGISAAAAWAERGNTTIVGEQVGDELEMWSEGGNLRLPNSGFKAHFANGLHSYSMAPCPANVPCTEMSVRTLKPDVPVTLSWKEYLAGRDPVMEAVLSRQR